MKACILSMGDELVLGQIQERNAGWLSSRLADMGVETVEHRTVGDHLEDIVAALDALARRGQLLLTTGGLGPTDDDLLRPALSRLLRDGDMVEDPAARADITRWFAGRGRPMPAINLRQALRPPSASIIHNPVGTAPGLRATLHGTPVVCMPGPPGEMQPMFEQVVVPLVAAAAPARLLRAGIPVVGLGESAVAERLGDRMERHRNPLVGTTASGGVVTVRIRARDDAALDEAAFRAVVRQVESLLAPWCLGEENPSLAHAVGRLLQSQERTVAVAESCTAGLVAAALTAPAGSSAWFRGGVSAYANGVKVSLLGVPEATIEANGAVSAPVALAMARGARTRLAASCGIGITGIAGPAGAEEGKPVGTVHIAVVVGPGPGEGESIRRFRFPGDRSAVRERATQAALQMLRFRLLGTPDSPLLWQESAG